MKLSLFTFFLIISSGLFSQNKIDTIYLTSSWEKTEDLSRTFYFSIREYDETNTTYLSSIYSMDGVLKNKSMHKFGLREGLTTWYYDNGIKSREGYFEAGIHVGEFRFYNKTGKLYEISNYENDEEVTFQKIDTLTGERIGELKNVEDYPDESAEFVGGAVEMMNYIQANVSYPTLALENGDQGKVYISFVVEKDGSVSNVAVEKSVSKELDREAKRVISEMPVWTPGLRRGEPAKTRCRIPIVFTLELSDWQQKRETKKSRRKSKRR